MQNVPHKLSIPFIDVSEPMRLIKDRYLRQLSEFLEGGQYILTKEVEDFEKAWSDKNNAKYCVGCASGGSAINLAMLGLGIGVGDEVITQGNAFNASVAEVLHTGAGVRFADIEPDTLCIDVSKIERLITPKTKAILAVHLYGQMNDMESIGKIAKKYNLFIVEDCAQAHLAEYKGRKAGTWGDIGTFSFYPTKNLGAFGDAGCVITDSKDLYEKMKAIRHLGQVVSHDHRYLGYNMRLDPVQAIALHLKLEFLDEMTRIRQDIGRYYNKLFENVSDYIKPVAVGSNRTHVYHMYVVRSLRYDRDKLREELWDKGIGSGIHYPFPVYQQPFYLDLFGDNHDQCPITDMIASQIISLPLFIGISKEQQELVADTIMSIVKS